MKRIIGLSFLFLANIVVLAHAVIPHHHHGKILVSVCHILSVEEAFNHKHENCHLECGEQEHSNHFANEDCILSQLYIPSNETLTNSNDSEFENFHSYLPIICYDTTSLIEIQDYGEQPFRQKPYLDSYHTYYITHSLGLRAPPSC